MNEDNNKSNKKKNGCLLSKNLTLLIVLVFSFSLILPASGLPVFTGEGSGTEADPYRVTNVSQLNQVRNDLSAHYILMNDIDASETETWNADEGWEPIGPDFGSQFAGSFDGQGHKINGLYINRSDSSSIGLFGQVGDGAKIKNVGLTNVNITGGWAVGSLVGCNSGGTLTNTYSTGTVTGDSEVGGLVGSEGSVRTIIDSHSSCTVTGSENVGGLVGSIDGDGSVIDSYATGDVSGLYRVGGLFGQSYGSIENSYATGNVFEKSGTDIDSVGGLSEIMGVSRGMLGGLAGSNSGSIDNSYATGNVDADASDYVGGLIGQNRGTIDKTYSSGTVSGYDFVGGLVGYEGGSHKTILNSYSTGAVTGNASVGGLVGVIYEGTVINSYSIGTVNGEYLTGGLVGYNESGTISNAYWNTQTSGISDSAAGEGKTTSQLKQQSTFVNWDFDEIWYIHPSINNGYPQLRYLITSYPAAAGSSGSRTSIGQSPSDEIIDSAYSSIKYILIGKVDYDFSDTDSPVYGISFDSKDNMGLVLAKVEVLNSAPEGVPSPSGKAFRLLSITVGSQGTVSDQNADNIALNFRVDWEWIRENNIDPSTIRIVRFHNGNWEDLPTTQLYDDGEMIHYTAQTLGFSIFSIIGDEIAHVTESGPIELADDDTSEQVPSEKKTPGFTAALAFIVLSVAFLGSRKN